MVGDTRATAGMFWVRDIHKVAGEGPIAAIRIKATVPVGGVLEDVPRELCHGNGRWVVVPDSTTLSVESPLSMKVSVHSRRPFQRKGHIGQTDKGIGQ